MPMTTFDKWLWRGVALLLCAILAPVALHIRGWCKGMDNLQDRAQRVEGNIQAGSQYIPEAARAAKDTLVHADKAVGEAARAAEKSVTASRDTDEAMKNVNGLVLKLGKTADAATGAVNNLGSVASSAQAQIEPTFTRFQTTLDRTNSLLSTTSDQVVKVGPFLTSATTFMGSANGLVSDPALHGSLVNIQGFMLNMQGISGDVGHVTHRFAYPPKQNVLQRVWALTPLAKDVAEMGYYTGAW